MADKNDKKSNKAKPAKPADAGGPEKETAKEDRLNFVEQLIEEHNRTGRFGGKVHTRFPPEPNGYLHIGHAKAICADFGLAEKYGGKCNLRMDDTNPSKEETEYVDAIKDDIHWLGFDWEDRFFFASDYFEQLYDWAEKLITDGKAFVCDLTGDEMREYRGTLTEPGKNSPYRDRTPEENLKLFRGMRAGEFPDGSKTLRAKIDMASPNINFRDPVMYRIMRAHHHRTGDTWCIYPTYDWAHGQSDSIEGITHSICTLEFENHRPLYDWYVEQLGIHAPQQIEFARLNLTYTVMSKRKLLTLVKEKHVKGWDDPRMPTICGFRRRGYTAESIRNFCDTIGIAKFNSTINIGVLENSIRDHLNRIAPRVMAVLDPIKVVITNYPEGESEIREGIVNPEDPDAGTRQMPFSGEIYIDREDFMEDPPKKFFRLSPGTEVRLRNAYFLKCNEVIKDDAGEVVELRCTYDPETAGGKAPDGRKVKATIHWVDAAGSVPAEVRLYDNLFTRENPDKLEEGEDWLDNLNPESLTVLSNCRIEPSIKTATAGDRFQFERLGYFCMDPDSTDEKLVFNRTVSLRDEWSKIQKKG